MSRVLTLMATFPRSDDTRHSWEIPPQRESNVLADDFWGTLQLDNDKTVDDNTPNNDSSDEYTDIDDRAPEMVQKRGSTPMINFSFLLTSNGTIKADFDDTPKTSPHIVITQRSERSSKVNYSLPMARPKLAPPVLEAAPSTPLWRRRRRQATKRSATGLQRRQATRVPNRKASPEASPTTEFEDLEELTWSDCSTPVTPIEMEWPDVDCERKIQVLEVIGVKEAEGGTTPRLCGLRSLQTDEAPRKDEELPLEIVNTPTTVIETHSSCVLDGPADSAEEFDVLSRLAWDRQLLNSKRPV